MKHKLAYVLDVYPHGQTHIVNELKTLESNNMDVHIIGINRPGKSHQIRVDYKTRYPIMYLFNSENEKRWGRFIKENMDCVLNYPVNYILTAIRSIRWGGSNFKLAASFVKALEVVNPTLVYVNWSWHYCGSVMYACRILKLPFIFSVQGTDIAPPPCNFALRVRTAERIITPSPGYVEILKKELDVPVHKIQLVPNCFFPNSFDKVKPARAQIDGPLRLLYVGTLRPVKRHEDLIRCCSTLRDKGIKFECRVFGDGPDRQKLETLISGLNLTGIVSLRGHVPQEKLPEQFEWCDIYLHPSERESFGYAIIEAQASARPIILSDGIGGMRDSVIPGKTALMVSVGQPNEFAKAIMMLANDSERRLQMGQAGREFVLQNFTYERFRPQFLKALFGKDV